MDTSAQNEPLIDFNRIEQKIDECISVASKHFGQSLRIPTYNFRQRGRAAGTAYLQRNEIRLNSYMYSQSPEEFITHVVPHEVAHIIVYQIYGANPAPHGKEWKFVMEQLLRVPAVRTHNFDLPPRKKGYEYRCECSVHEFTAQRHSRARKGTEYMCRKCRTVLSYTGNMKTHGKVEV